MNPNIKKIIDAAPKGTGERWISINHAEDIIASAVRMAASVARAEVLERSGVKGEFEGTVDVETRILDHFGL